jgi:hypothetical protein
MFFMSFVVFLMASVTFAGSFVLAVLILPIGLNNAMGVIGAVALGTILAVPVAYMVAKAMGGKEA